MNTKDITLEDLGYKLTFQDEEMIIYKNKTDYIDYSIFFRLGKNPTYDIWFSEWWDDKSDGWVPMDQRETEWLKHCSRYGHWQKVDCLISIELHQAIHNKLKDLGVVR